MEKYEYFLLAYCYYAEYEDTVEDARGALFNGNKLGAVALAIQAHKLRSNYEYYWQKYILFVDN
jgi:hypothetical protein